MTVLWKLLNIWCMLNQEHKDETLAGPKQDSSRTHHPRTVYIQALQTKKITKLGLLSLPPLFFNNDQITLATF